jgi:hypothetical protein
MQKLAVAAEEKAKEEKRNFVNGRHVKAVSHGKTIYQCMFCEIIYKMYTVLVRDIAL